MDRCVTCQFWTREAKQNSERDYYGGKDITIYGAVVAKGPRTAIGVGGKTKKGKK